MNRYSIEDLRYFQAMPLDLKVRMTKQRLREWIREYGEGGCCVSFSGGKDSTVLLDIVREDYPDVKAVFVDVPTQYPELRDFVKTYDNVDIVRPKMNFMQVCETYGFPIISKEVTEAVYEAKISIRRGKTDTYRFKQLMGTAVDPNTGILSPYNKGKWKFLLDAPFDVSNLCCKVMKKAPLHKYQKDNKLMPITAQMAEESRLRTQQWLRNSCNGFEMKNPVSNPMAFWTEQDVLRYIYEHKLPICKVYGQVVKEAEVMGQMDITDFGDDLFTPTFKTTGCKRTGCMLCGFGCHLESKEENRFLRLKETHPKMYAMLDIVKNNGYTMRQAIEWINENGNLKIIC